MERLMIVRANFLSLCCRLDGLLTTNAKRFQSFKTGYICDEVLHARILALLRFNYQVTEEVGPTMAVWSQIALLWTLRRARPRLTEAKALALTTDHVTIQEAVKGPRFWKDIIANSKVIAKFKGEDGNVWLTGAIDVGCGISC
jgi:hypothetical protein